MTDQTIARPQNTLFSLVIKGLRNPARAISYTLNKLAPPPKVHLDSIFGCSFYQNNRDIMYYGEFNGLSIADVRKRDPEFDVMAEYIRPGSIAIDVGANIGFYTLGLSRLVGAGGQVHAFEPGPVSFALLSRNVYANASSLGMITLNKAAVSDRNGKTNLFLNTSGDSDNQVHHDIDEYKYKGEDSRPKLLTDVVSLDEYFKGQNPNISFIKVDTQGHEYYVLKGAEQLLRESKDIVLVVEYAAYLKAWETVTQDEFYELIKSMGFRIYDVINKDVEVDNVYLKANYGHHQPGKWTSLVLKK